MNFCVFCQIIHDLAPASSVLRGATVAAFLDLKPVSRGHVLVVPLRHAVTLAELDEDSAAALMLAARRVTVALALAGYSQGGANLYLADGAFRS